MGERSLSCLKEKPTGGNLQAGNRPSPPLRPCSKAQRFHPRLSSRNAELRANLIRKRPAHGVGLPVHDGDGWTNESWEWQSLPALPQLCKPAPLHPDSHYSQRRPGCETAASDGQTRSSELSLCAGDEARPPVLARFLPPLPIFSSYQRQTLH